jgi:pimeloyl-ACP methyl ester carboxylesterase
MGGMVTLRLALDHPDVVAERVAGIVLMSTSGGPVVRLAAWDAVADLVTPPAAKVLALGDRVPGGIFRPNDLSYLVFRLGMGRSASADHVELNRLMTASTPLASWSGLIAEVARFDVVDRLREIDVPARVLVGTRDLLTPPSSARRLVRELPRAEPLVAFPGAGHMLMLERRDEVAEQLASFAAGLP